MFGQAGFTFMHRGTAGLPYLKFGDIAAVEMNVISLSKMRRTTRWRQWVITFCAYIRDMLRSSSCMLVIDTLANRQSVPGSFDTEARRTIATETSGARPFADAIFRLYRQSALEIIAFGHFLLRLLSILSPAR